MATETSVADAAHAAEAAAHGDHYVGMPQLNFDWFSNQIFWLVLTLLAIYFVLSRIALPRIGSILSDRQGAITKDLAAAEELRQKAVESEAAYDRALVEARAEAGRISAETRAEIQQDLDLAISKADAEIAAKTAESERAIAEIRASSAESIRQVAQDTALEIVRVMGAGGGDARAIAAAVAARLKG